MSHRRCLICHRLVLTVMRLAHVTNEHPVVAATFKQERADIGVLFEEAAN